MQVWSWQTAGTQGLVLGRAGFGRREVARPPTTTAAPFRPQAHFSVLSLCCDRSHTRSGAAWLLQNPGHAKALASSPMEAASLVHMAQHHGCVVMQLASRLSAVRPLVSAHRTPATTSRLGGCRAAQPSSRGRLKVLAAAAAPGDDLAAAGFGAAAGATRTKQPAAEPSPPQPRKGSLFGAVSLITGSTVGAGTIFQRWHRSSRFHSSTRVAIDNSGGLHGAAGGPPNCA